MGKHLLGVWMGQSPRRGFFLLGHLSRGTCSSSPGLRQWWTHCLGPQFPEQLCARRQGCCSAQPRPKQPKQGPPNERAGEKDVP